MGLPEIMAKAKAPAKKPAAKKASGPKKAIKKKTPAKKSPAKKKPKDADMFKRSGDANNDGKVTRSEAKAAGKKPTSDPADLNNDGKVTRAEKAALKKTKLAPKSPKKKTAKKKA